MGPSAPRQFLRRFLPRSQLMRPRRRLRRIQLVHWRWHLPRPQLMHRRRRLQRQLMHRRRRRRLRRIISLRCRRLRRIVPLLLRRLRRLRGRQLRRRLRGIPPGARVVHRHFGLLRQRRIISRRRTASVHGRVLSRCRRRRVLLLLFRLQGLGRPRGGVARILLLTASLPQPKEEKQQPGGRRYKRTDDGTGNPRLGGRGLGSACAGRWGAGAGWFGAFAWVGTRLRGFQRRG